MPVNQHAIRVGANVRAEIARRGLSQAKLAEQLKGQPGQMSQQKLSRCISGQQVFRVDELQVVADALNVPLAQLLVEPEAASA